ncbi:MAG: exodeoxyribonuclease III, partial [Proteobacteria bacterium]|nr:exodeoxyribonuclease III [Pseudomonadota bacterium]
PRGYHCRYHDAQKPGYSGVAIYSRHEPDEIIEGLDWPEFDAEGRYIEYRFGKLSVVSLYLPSGSSGEIRQQIKFQVMERLMHILRGYRRRKREYIVCGDWNIAHKEIDLKNWRGNRKNSGFLPEEREWLTELFDKAGWVDAFRVVNQEADQYTWWSNRGQAWAKNVGWRIDYHIVTPGLADKVKSTDIYLAERFSDHAPLTLHYAMRIEDFR